MGVAACMMAVAGSLVLAERAVEPLRGCLTRCLFNIVFRKGFSRAVPVGLAIRVAVGRRGVHDGCGWVARAGGKSR